MRKKSKRPRRNSANVPSMRKRGERPRSNKVRVPLWVLAGISSRYGFLRSRNSAIWNAWLMTLVAPIAIVVSLFSAGDVRRFALVAGLFTLPVALLMWLAIRWLDRRKAWHVTHQMERIRFR